MELELDLKLSKTIDNNLGSTDFRIGKDRAGPLFLTRETGALFILTAHLRGYTKENIKIDINEDGTLISISGNKMVQEMVMKEWAIHEEEPNMKGFMKVYRIPSDVILDKIKADYNDGDSTLSIYMPKLNKGINGGGIEEVKDEKQKQVSEECLHEENVCQDVKDNEQQEKSRHGRNGRNEIEEVVSNLGGDVYDEEAMVPKKYKKDIEEVSSSKESKGKVKEKEIVEEELGGDCDPREVEELSKILKGEEGEKGEGTRNQHELEEKNKSMLCAPCFFIVAMLFRLVKAKRQ